MTTTTHTAATDPVIEVRSLTKRFGSMTALDGVSITVPADSITGLLGRNGAGKTTLMHVLTGQDFPTSGEARVFGRAPAENASVLQHIAFVKESQKYPDDFKPKHVLRSAPWFFENWDADFAAQLVDNFRLPVNRRIKKLSRGQLSAVGVIVGLASRAPLTFLFLFALLLIGSVTLITFTHSWPAVGRWFVSAGPAGVSAWLLGASRHGSTKGMRS
jgi:ABC-2 type transport system ATP-binding protein